jgi:hypothetical protein
VRVNVYNEELTDEVEIAAVEPRPGRRYIGIRFILASSSDLHHTPGDDDRSAVTLWVGSAEEGRALLSAALTALNAEAPA